MQVCPICKDRRTERELKENRYLHNRLYISEVKIGSRKDQYFVCDKCKSSWRLPPTELIL